MPRTSWRFIVLLCGLLIVLRGHPSAAQELDEVMDAYDIPPSSYYGQPYLPYPPQQMLPVQSQSPVKRPWYKRILNPFVRQASPPIYQVQKPPTEKPKETQALPNPLIRLAKGIRYEDKTVFPGLYLLEFQPGSSEKEAFLSLVQKQERLLRIPAKALSTEKLLSQALPSPPDKSRDKTKTTPAEESLGRVELSQDGQTVVLIYQQGQRQYVSDPLMVGDLWHP